LFQAASMTRFVRSAMLDVVRLDYVTTARAKGLGQKRVIVKHVMRNAMIPVVTQAGSQLGFLLGGTVIIENIFSLPTFFTGLLFILVFSITLDWLPFVYTTDIKATGFRWLIEQIRQAIMPVMVLALFQAASMTRFVRSAMLDVIRLDYVTTARAKGLGQARVIVKHAMRNAMIPVVTLVALQMPAVFGGAIVTEQIFRIPGIGSLLISSILSNDTPVVMAVTFVFACLVVLFNLIADVLYGWLDPRISLR